MVQDQLSQTPIVSGRLRKMSVTLKLLKNLYKQSLSRSGSHAKAMSIIKQVLAKYKDVQGENIFNKATFVDGRYYWRFASPGFPSEAYKIMVNYEIDRVLPDTPQWGLSTVIFAITKKCWMNCEHCFEWENLNKPDTLQVSEIVETLKKYSDYGTTQFMFSGGEPMLRFDDLVQVLEQAPKNADYWVITSGFGMTHEKAQKLKNSGLTGLMVSLDHHLPEENDKFRGYKGAHSLALKAVRFANEAGLVTTLSLCVTRGYCQPEYLDAYMHLAKSLGVSFVQILEPRQTGRYSGKDILLSDDDTQRLDKYYTSYINSKKYKDYPMINYLGYHQRKVGCFGGGNRFFYIDTDGDAHLCPYCSGKKISVLTNTAEEVIKTLQTNHCHAFENTDY